MMRHHVSFSSSSRWGHRGWVCLALPVWLAAAPALATSDLAVVALSNRPPTPEIRPEAFFRFDDPPVINDMGEVAFLAGPSVAAGNVIVGGTSVWKGNEAGLLLVANQDQPAGLEDRSSFASFTNVRVNNHSDIGFEAALDGPTIDSSNGDTLWLQSAGGPRHLIARTGMAPPGTTGEKFEALESMPGLSDAGNLAFFARTRNDDNQQQGGSGMWVGSAAQTQPIAFNGTPAATGQPDETFARQSFEIPFGETVVISPVGQTVFRGFLEGPAVDEFNAAGIWTHDVRNGLELAFRAGQTAPGTGGEPFIGFSTVPGINRAGDLAFVAFFGQRPSPESSAGEAGGNAPPPLSGVWVASDDLVEPVLTIGDPASEVGPDATFVDLFSPVINARGRIALTAVVGGSQIDDSNELGIWSDGLRGGRRIGPRRAAGRSGRGGH